MKPWEATHEQIVNGCLILPNCPDCNGTGTTQRSQLTVAVDEKIEEKTVTVPCDCKMMPARLLDKANIPPGRFARLTLHDLDWSRYDDGLVGSIQGYAEGLTDYVANGIGLTLIGNVGTGKTHVSVGMVALACGLGIEARFVSMAELLARLRASYDDPQDRRTRRLSEADILDEFSSVPLLAVDDLGTGKPTEWVRDRLYFLINRRYTAALATIVTSNLAPHVLEARLGERTVSRIWGTSITVQFTGEDHRNLQKIRMLAGMG